MVFVHGGSFLYGSGTFPIYDGANLAAATGHVVVTMNYRLGALGFLSNPALRAEDPTNPSLGRVRRSKIRIAAFQWVQANIAAFGGDPANVTIFGESAGGTSMFLHLVSPKSAGLFARVIVESGARGRGLSRSADGAGGCTRSIVRDGARVHRRLHLMTCLRGQSVSSILAHRGERDEPYVLAGGQRLHRPRRSRDPLRLRRDQQGSHAPREQQERGDPSSSSSLPPPTTRATSRSRTRLVAGQGSAIVAEYPISSFSGSYEAAAAQP